MKKIAIFQADLNYGGIQKSLVNLLNNIDYKNYEIDLFLVDKNNIYIKDINKNVNIFYLNKLSYLSRLIPFNLLKKIYKYNNEKEYDIAIDYNGYSNECAIGAIKTRANKKIMWIHNDLKIKFENEFKFKLLYFFSKKKYNYFNKFIAVSNGALDSFKSISKLNEKEYDVIPNIIDVNYILEKAKEKTNIKVSKDKINIVSVGRVEYQKGFDILIDNINSIKDKLINYHFYIVGDGKELNKIKEMVKDYKLDDYISFLGYQKNPYNIMNIMDAFILTSRYEGQGMVFLEAYLLGLDVIMPKHLTKYVDYITGSSNITTSILESKKHNKKRNDLSNYNNKIIDKFNKL